MTEVAKFLFNGHLVKAGVGIPFKYGVMAVPGYVLKNKRTTLERAEKFISQHEWTDCNLYGRLYKARAPVANIKHYAAPGRITFKEALSGLQSEGQPAKLGQAFGPTWATHWFEIEYSVPPSWKGEEVRLIWNSNSEAMVWCDGKPMQGLTNDNRRNDYILSSSFKEGKGESGIVHIEMACNRVGGAGKGGEIYPPDPNLTFYLETLELAVLDSKAFQLFTDFQVIIALAKKLPDDSNRAYQALHTANNMVNTVILDDYATYRTAHEMAEQFFAQHNGASQHVMHAVGNCHIDSAWLWPYAETIRKCARSFSSTIRLMERYPDFKFACSQAQQFEWVKINYPDLYADMKRQIAKGSFIPVGGVWIEMDGLMPSGEANIRQFLFGQRFFEKEFGHKCKEFWLPDTFGYSGQLPQIMRHVGIERFLTQKLSWNLVNKFPHNTFYWHGIDGSPVLAHFPPGDDYTQKATVDEVLFSLQNFKDKGRSNTSMFLYGHGDGGQGPTAEMIERLQRMENVDGLAKVKMSTPDDFFTEVEHHDSENLCHWSGELYLELHNGTYTSQAKTKNGNRRCEFLLHNIEAIASLASVTSQLSYEEDCPAKPYNYPRAELARLWKLVLLNQFHDVLPGSSIHDVYKDALAYYKDVIKSGSQLLADAVTQLCDSRKWEKRVQETKGFGVGSGKYYWIKEGHKKDLAVLNTQGWGRTEVVTLPDLDQNTESRAEREKWMVQVDYLGNQLALVCAPSYGYNLLTPLKTYQPVEIVKRDDLIYMSNEHVQAVIDSHGRLTELYRTGCNKNGIAPNEFGNQLVLFDDVPLYWDAWDVMDYHLETRKPLQDLIHVAIVRDEGPLRATIEVSIKVSDNSLVKQFISLDAGCPYIKFDTEVCWHESHKFLKVEFPLNVHSDKATYEIAFGHLQRPTHFNTSWDWAKFEVCGHKWADLSEYGFGVSVLNDNKYGWSCINNVLRLSLLRSPKAPDEKCDMGTQHFSYAIMPHTGTFQEEGVIEAAHILNNPLLVADVALSSTEPSRSFFKVDTKQVVLDTVKLAEENDKAIVLRFYEAFGGRCTAKLQADLPVKEAYLCNGLEEVHNPDQSRLEMCKEGQFNLSFTPFQIVSVMLKL